MPGVKLRAGASGTVMKLAPSKTAVLFEWLCGVQVTPPPRLPVLLLPETSAALAPLPSSKAYAATSPKGAALETVTVTSVATIVLPAVSVARAEIVWFPFTMAAVFQITEYDGPAPVTSAPSGVPSTKNCTPAMARLSVAVAVTVTDPDTVVAAAGAVMPTTGRVLSTVQAAPAGVGSTLPTGSIAKTS